MIPISLNSTLNFIPYQGVAINTPTCTGPIKIVTEGRKSFPSGHASTSFCSMVYLALFWCGYVKLFNTKRAVENGDAWKWMGVIIPLIGAVLVSVTRVTDYRHHWYFLIVNFI